MAGDRSGRGESGGFNFVEIDAVGSRDVGASSERKTDGGTSGARGGTERTAGHGGRQHRAGLECTHPPGETESRIKRQKKVAKREEGTTTSKSCGETISQELQRDKDRKAKGESKTGVLLSL